VALWAEREHCCILDQSLAVAFSRLVFVLGLAAKVLAADVGFRQRIETYDNQVSESYFMVNDFN
jgi:hypothetical protein